MQIQSEVVQQVADVVAEDKKMQNSTIIGLILFIIVLVGGFMFINGKSSVNGDVIADGDAQIITLGIKDYNYYPNTITVKANQPVRIYLDESVGGCYRSFTVREFGVSKYLRSPEDYVEFVPTKTGTFGFSCSMGMGTGTLIVE